MRPGNIENDGIWDLDELARMEDKSSRLSQWGMVRPDTFKAGTVTRKALPAGCYAINRDMNDGQPIFFKKEVKIDESITPKGSLIETTVKEISEFWAKAEIFKQHGFLHRRGYLLYGPQGMGKSYIVQQIMDDVISKGGLVFICENPSNFSLGLKVLRQAEPDRALVCVFEDIDAIIKKYGEDDILAILDGANQVDRVLNIATTNYPESLDKRIISRPRRFDRIYKVGEPTEEVRRAYLKSKLPKTEKLDKWVEETKGLSFAGLAEAMVSTLCLGNTLKQTVEILRDIENGHPSSQDFGGALGFAQEEEAALPGN